MESLSCTPPDVKELANKALDNLMPTKSRAKYQKEYKSFTTWCDQNNVNSITENVVLAYFQNMTHLKKSLTMWSNYSMLKTCLNINKNIDISKFLKVTVFLKRISKNYVPKKSKVLEFKHIEKFFVEANDDCYLAMKNALIIGYSGACRLEELMFLSIKDIEFKIDSIIVSIPKTKNNVPQVFLRPAHTPHDRYFLTYREGKCSILPIGINKIGQMPKSIATFLNLSNPEFYTGHCFRRNSVSEFANRGGDLITIKKHGGWKSSAVAEGYIDATITKKFEVAQKLSQHLRLSNLQLQPIVKVGIGSSIGTSANTMFTSRKDLIRIMRRSEAKRFEQQFQFMVEELKKRTNCDESNDINLKIKMRKFKAEGQVQASKVLKDITTFSPARANKYREAYKKSLNSQIQPLSGEDALAVLIDAKLSREQYNIIRKNAPEKFPSYKSVQAAKTLCYPKNITVTETSASVKLQTLLDHITERLCLTLDWFLNFSVDRILLIFAFTYNFIILSTEQLFYFCINGSGIFK
ncbi:hypothetical protein RN001_004669 [Aquatica leii]|uniref:Tyr recombinase domain-containing protein n=1 Tax=Aquatica leii TaxID=1421715 RepID=A0AAN7P5M3_9COLE|nr:hypothetical protein RN001_004669 [Aquatica leii]